MRRGRIGARAGEREAVVSGVAAEALSNRLSASVVLVVDDVGGVIADRLRSQGCDVRVWNRWAWRGLAALPWPADGPFEAATLRLPREWASFEMQVRVVAARLAEGGRLFVAGANDEGIRSAERRLAEVFDRVRTIETRRHCRVIEAHEPRALRLTDVAPERWRERLRVALPLASGEEEVELVSYPGVFSAGRLDEGTALLVAALGRLEPAARVLDFGCGHGAVGVALNRLFPASQLTLLDVDALALEAAKLNLPGSATILSDGWHAVEPEARFDLIVSNPPIHRGRDEDFEALEALVRRSPRHLTPRGVLVLVTQRTVGVGKLVASRFRRWERLAETPRFEVIRARG